MVVWGDKKKTLNNNLNSIYTYLTKTRKKCVKKQQQTWNSDFINNNTLKSIKNLWVFVVVIRRIGIIVIFSYLGWKEF